MTGRCDPGRPEGSSPGSGDPLGRPWNLEGRDDLDGPTEDSESLGDRGLDELERGTTDKGRQDLDADRAVAVRDVDAMHDPQIDDGKHRQLGVRDLDKRGTD